MDVLSVELSGELLQDIHNALLHVKRLPIRNDIEIQFSTVFQINSQKIQCKNQGISKPLNNNFQFKGFPGNSNEK